MPFCDLTDVRCYYDVRGRAAAPPVLMIPGLAATSADWPDSTHRLADDFLLIQPDNRGMGLSVARQPAVTLHHYSADLIELLDHLQLERVHIVGLSLGGIIAQRFAIDHPDRVDRLVLMSCAYRFGPYLREMAGLVGKMMLRFSRDGFTRTMELLGSGPMYLDGDPQRLDRKVDQVRSRAISRKAVARQLRCLAASDPQPDEYRRITAKTLVISGEYDTLIPHCYGRQIARLVAGAQFMLVRHAGHNLFRECPDRVIPQLIRFLHGQAVVGDADNVLEVFHETDRDAA